MKNENISHILLRYGIATVGLFLVAVGVALSVIVNLGTAPLSTIAYLLNLELPSVSLGEFTIIVNMSYIVIQLALLRKRFRISHLMQILASVIFGYMIDLSMLVFAWLQPITVNFTSKIIVTMAAALVTAFGVSVEVAADSWMLSAEMTVAAIVDVFKTDFGKTKIAMDTVTVVLAMIIAVLFFGNPFGSTFTNMQDVIFARSEGVVIGLGTVILAFLPGFFMRYTDKLVKYRIIKLIVGE